MGRFVANALRLPLILWEFVAKTLPLGPEAAHLPRSRRVGRNRETNVRRFITTAVLILNGLTVTGCGTRVHDVVRAEAAQFRERLDSGHLEDMPPSYEKKHQWIWLRNMQPRLQLGKRVSSSEVHLVDVTGNFRLVMIFYNSEFQHGTGLEQFDYIVGDDGHVRLENYQFHAGVKLDCVGWLAPDCRAIEVATGKIITTAAR
jgi:hypothetical protein